MEEELQRSAENGEETLYIQNSYKHKRNSAIYAGSDFAVLFYVSLFKFNWGSKESALVRALASHKCGPGSNPGDDAICGLSLLLVLSFAPGGFSPGTPVFSSP